MKIAFLLGSAYGMGGTIRATLTLANDLARRHEVEIITLNRWRTDPFFDVDARITLHTLMDAREGARTGRLDAALGRHNSRLTPRSDKIWPQVTMRGDYHLLRALRTLDADVLVTTRPAFNLLAARFAPRHVVLVGQEHVHLAAHHEDLREHIRSLYPRMDALVTLTDADRNAYAAFLGEAAPRIEVMPNPLPGGPKPVSRLDTQVIAAAGRLVRVKRYDRLIAAFAKVRAVHPDWVLRIYGSGPEEERLRAVAARHRLGDGLAFMGRTDDIYGAFSQASIVVLSSSYEGFGMTITEAFACGVPVVSFDCPQGPAEIITHDHNGLLVPPRDVDALAGALIELIDDPVRRQAMGAAARRDAARYDVTTIAGNWEDLLAGLVAARERRRSRGGTGALAERGCPAPYHHGAETSSGPGDQGAQ